MIFNNDGNAAALYAHHADFGPVLAAERSSVSVIVGTGLGGGVVESGQVIRGAAGMAGELGHIWLPLDGPARGRRATPTCNCGLPGDAESVASLTGIEKNLLPFRLTKFPGHPLASEPAEVAAKLVRGYGEAGRPASPQDLRSAGHGDRQALHDRRELHRPARVPAGRRRSGGGAGISAAGSWTGSAPRRRCAPSRRPGPRSRWCPTWTWPGPGAGDRGPRGRPGRGLSTGLQNRPLNRSSERPVRRGGRPPRPLGRDSRAAISTTGSSRPTGPCHGARARQRRTRR